MEGKERRVLTYYFPLVYTYFPLHMRLPIIHDIFSFRKIIIVIIVYGRKRKMCIIFRRKLDGFGRILIDIIGLWKKKKDVYYFWKENK